MINVAAKVNLTEPFDMMRQEKMFLIANIVTGSKAPVTTSVALVPNSEHCY